MATRSIRQFFIQGWVAPASVFCRVSVTFPVLVCMIFVLGSCVKESTLSDASSLPEGVQPRSVFSDSSGWELSYIFNVLADAPDSVLIPFVEDYGIPQWEYASQRRGDDVYITTVPIVRNDSITGVIKLWHSAEDDIRLGFLSKAAIDAAMGRLLNTQEYHYYRGGAISLLTSYYLKDEVVMTGYVTWLGSTSGRITERSVYHCTATCDVYVSSVTGWAYFDQISFNPVMYGGGCAQITFECWETGGPGTGSGDEGGLYDILEYGSGPNPGGSGGGGSSTSSGANPNRLEQWLLDKGLGLGLYDRLIECAGTVIPNPKDPDGPHKVTNIDMGCLYAKTLQSLLNISEQEALCVSANPEVAEEVIGWIAEGSVIDVCSPERATDDILEDAISAACGAGGIGELGDIIGKFDQADYIIINPNLKTECPLYDCIMRKMINNGTLGTQLVCSLLSNFEAVDGQHLQMVPGAFAYPNQNPNAYAATAVVEGRICIFVNTIKCNSIDAIDVFETIQHELIHADIRRRLLEDYSWNGDELNISESFLKMVELEYGAQATLSDHELMLDYYLDLMVESLIAANDNVGTREDFIGLVLNGFEEEVLNSCGLAFEDVSVAYNNYLTFISQPGNLSSIFTECD